MNTEEIRKALGLPGLESEVLPSPYSSVIEEIDHVFWPESQKYGRFFEFAAPGEVPGVEVVVAGDLGTLREECQRVQREVASLGWWVNFEKFAQAKLAQRAGMMGGPGR